MAVYSTEKDSPPVSRDISEVVSEISDGGGLVRPLSQFILSEGNERTISHWTSNNSGNQPELLDKMESTPLTSSMLRKIKKIPPPEKKEAPSLSVIERIDYPLYDAVPVVSAETEVSEKTEEKKVSYQENLKKEEFVSDVPTFSEPIIMSVARVGVDDTETSRFGILDHFIRLFKGTPIK